MQIIKSFLIILIFFSCGQKATNSSLNSENESDWLGKYYLFLEGGSIDGINIGWNYNLNIGIDSITFEQEGYKLYKYSLLKIKSYSKDSIEIDYNQSLEGVDISNTDSPFLTLYNKNGKYYIRGIHKLETTTTFSNEFNGYKILKIDNSDHEHDDSVQEIKINETNLLDLLTDKSTKNGYDFVSSEYLSDFYDLNYDKFSLRVFSLDNIDFKLYELIYLEDFRENINNPKDYIRFLMITNANNIITDTLRLNKGMYYTIDVITDQSNMFLSYLSMGIYYPNKEYFEIHNLFGLNDIGKLSKIGENIQIFDCPPPVDYWSDDDAGKYKFGFKNEKRYSRFWNEEL